MANTYLISVRPTWADSFFLDCNPKTIELRKGSFGASLKPGDSIVIYATLPEAKTIGTVFRSEAGITADRSTVARISARETGKSIAAAI